MTDVMHQQAPYPHVLHDLVLRLRYKAGWYLSLLEVDRGQGSKGLTFVITITGPDTHHPETKLTVVHYMIVPPAAYDERSWQRWLFEQILLVERHEAMEWFQLTNGSDLTRPYAPSHGPGNDPYLVREVGTITDQRTSFRGEVNPPPEVCP